MTDVLERFFRYVQIDTTSAEEMSDHVPSSTGQFELAQLLVEELHELGIDSAQVDEHCYVTAQVPASLGSEHSPALGLLAHIDTSEAAPGKNVRPHIVHYDGGPLVCGTLDGQPVQITPEKMPALSELEGLDLVCSDGTTLLGGDDKAGIAEIMALVARLAHNPSLPHPSLGICFCPDEEIGHGAALLDIAAFGCEEAYTVDGGALGEIEWECFNAASVTLTAQGYSIHPGDAKGRMINALELIHRFHSMLPADARPEYTEGYEGFYHLMSVSGTVTHATARYIVRDHSAERYQQKLSYMKEAAVLINSAFGDKHLVLVIEEQYRNMAEIVGQYPHLIAHAKAAFEACEIAPRTIAIRGGTDGAQLSFRGLPCPNLSTGGYCMHGVNEFIPVQSLERMVDVLQALVARFA